MGNNGSWCWSKRQENFNLPNLNKIVFQNGNYEKEFAQRAIDPLYDSIDKDKENKVEKMCLLI